MILQCDVVPSYTFLQVWWLDPELSYGSSELFVFTQGHSVCNRSFFPCFDTPAVKCTYSASVKVSCSTSVIVLIFSHLSPSTPQYIVH